MRKKETIATQLVCNPSTLMHCNTTLQQSSQYIQYAQILRSRQTPRSAWELKSCGISVCTCVCVCVSAPSKPQTIGVMIRQLHICAASCNSCKTQDRLAERAGCLAKQNYAPITLSSPEREGQSRSFRHQNLEFVTGSCVVLVTILAFVHPIPHKHNEAFSSSISTALWSDLQTLKQ